MDRAKIGYKAAANLTNSLRTDLPDNGKDRDYIFGVVIASEISEDRRRTLLTIAAGEPESLVVLVSGGADSFLEKFVRIDGAQSRLFSAGDKRIFLSIVGAATIPIGLKSSGEPMLELISFRRAKKAVQTEAQRIAIARGKLAIRYEREGLQASWSIGEFVQLLGVLGGSKKDELAQITALRILKHLMKTGDCSALAKLAVELSPDRRDRLKVWLKEYSPIKLSLDTQPIMARFNRHSERSFAIKEAAENPFYKMPK
ncbi:hypothetical protein [Alteripontixanthobacter maritimus]|nr:hypothetical protein [Alteripontixanthobacter maritimus]